LHLAATTSELSVETALAQLLETNALPTFAVVRDLVCEPTPVEVPWLRPPTLDLSVYDQLLPSQRLEVRS